MKEAVSVKINGGKSYYFSPAGLPVTVGSHVIVETAKGVEFGEVTGAASMIDDTRLSSPLKNVLRIATAQDFETAEENRRRARDAMEPVMEKIAQMGLPMKLVSVDFTFDRAKAVFYFTSEGRVDFRELIRELASMFHTRIEMRQIGVRYEARMLSGVGICGQQYCCSRFLSDFHPVSIKMAKEQGLSLNPTKISGSCGRLMCCLKYEQNTYEKLQKGMPKNGASITTPDGQGSILETSPLSGTAKVRLEADNAIRTYKLEDCQIRH